MKAVITVELEYDFDPTSDSYNHDRPLTPQECVDIDVNALSSGEISLDEFENYTAIRSKITGKVIE